MNLHFDCININNLLSTSMDFSRLNTYKSKKSTVICQRTAADQFIQNVLKKDRYKISY